MGHAGQGEQVTKSIFFEDQFVEVSRTSTHSEVIDVELVDEGPEIDHHHHGPDHWCEQFECMSSAHVIAS